MLSTPNSCKFLQNIDCCTLSCAVSSYTGPIHLQATVLSPSGTNPSTPGGTSFVSLARSIAFCNFFSYVAFCFSNFSIASGVSSTGASGYLMPDACANVLRNICSSWKIINSRHLQIPYSYISKHFFLAVALTLPY